MKSKTSREQKLEDLILQQLVLVGENPEREGLVGTPQRIAKMYNEIFKGYDITQKPDITLFENGKDGVEYDQIITDTGHFFSHCEHHGVPFFGEYHFGYIPDKWLIGLSKVARTIDWYSAKYQIQERLTKEVVDEFEKVAQPLGTILVLEARHLCKEMRGVKKVGGKMRTSYITGIFAEQGSEAKNEFLSIIKNNH